jgi:hypothetical protein
LTYVALNRFYFWNPKISDIHPNDRTNQRITRRRNTATLKRCLGRHDIEQSSVYT